MPRPDPVTPPMFRGLSGFPITPLTDAGVELLGLASTPSLPPPLRGLPAEPREQLRAILAALEVRA